MIFSCYEQYRSLVEEELADIFDGVMAPVFLTEGMKYALVGGKRLRPCLLMATAVSLGADIQIVLPFACALELLHTASLVHDDLPCLDNDVLRRGKASNHSKYGYAQALLQGDGMINFAYTYLLKFVGDAATLRAARYIGEESGVSGMLGGQYEDVSAQGTECTEDKLYDICDRKTSSMFRAAVVGGACLAGETEIEHWRVRSDNLGLAFQIADDLIDAGKGNAIAGKTIGKDVSAQKKTFVTVFGENKAYSILKQILEPCNSYPGHLQEFARYILQSVQM